MTAADEREAGVPELGLWRLEWLRLRRTWRGISLVMAYLFFGLTGPLLARYMSAILERFSTGGMEVRVPDPTPADGLVQYLSNSQQIGTVMVLAVAAGALAIDASPDLAIFLRTRVTSPAQIILRRYAVYAVVGGAVFTLGLLAAWYETAVLIGALPAGAVLAGALAGVAYYAYLVALAAFAASAVRGVIGAVLITYAVVLLEPLIGLVRPLDPWLPSQLGTAVVALVAEDATALDFLRPLAVAAVLSALALWGAVRISARREV